MQAATTREKRDETRGNARTSSVGIIQMTFGGRKGGRAGSQKGEKNEDASVKGINRFGGTFRRDKLKSIHGQEKNKNVASGGRGLQEIRPSRDNGPTGGLGDAPVKENQNHSEGTFPKPKQPQEQGSL